MKGKSKRKKLCQLVTCTLAGVHAHEVVQSAIHYAEQTNSSFYLVTTNLKSPDFGDLVAKIFDCKVIRPFHLTPKYKKKVVWQCWQYHFYFQYMVLQTHSGIQYSTVSDQAGK